jgi:hypothetical protein
VWAQPLPAEEGGFALSTSVEMQNENRALNYLAVRYPAIYTTVADAFARNSSLTAVDVPPRL